MRRTGELSITEAAEMLEVHPDTVRNWVYKAMSGGPSRLFNVRSDVAGRYWIELEDIRRILREVEQSEFD